MPFHFLNYDFYTDHCSFGLFTADYEGTINRYLEAIDVSYIMKPCTQLVDCLTDLHEKCIAHNNISLSSIVITSDFQLYFHDFSRSVQMKTKTEEIGNFLTASKEFKAPEVYTELKYDPFKADVYSIALVILSLLRKIDMGKMNSQSVSVQIGMLENNKLAGCLRKMLNPDPRMRINMMEAGTELREETATRAL